MNVYELARVRSQRIRRRFVVKGLLMKSYRVVVRNSFYLRRLCILTRINFVLHHIHTHICSDALRILVYTLAINNFTVPHAVNFRSQNFTHPDRPMHIIIIFMMDAHTSHTGGQMRYFIEQ